MRLCFVALALFVAAAVGGAVPQDRFAYDASAPLELRQLDTSTADGIRTEQITYRSPGGGNVPAMVIAPAVAPRRGPAVVFVHWGLGDRHGWIDEARLLAGHGVVSLLIDAPFMRTRDLAQVPGQEANDIAQCVVDVRRGIDLLQARADVDGQRVGYVGLSFGAHVGAILSSVEPRVRALVLMGGLASNSEDMTKSAVPPEQRADHERAVAAMAELDAEKWVARPHASAVFLQFATHDEYISRAQADRYSNAAGRAAVTKWYEGGHEFVAPSRDDRVQWLAGHLGFSTSDPTYHQVATTPSPGFGGTRYAELSRFGVVLEVPGMQQIRVRENIVYKRIGERPLMMDVYYPFGMESEPGLRLPAIILVSGQAAAEVMPRLRGIRFVTTAARAIAARANRIVIVYDIRSIDETLAEVAGDLDDLIGYVRAHADELRIDGDSLAILARSAGGAYGMRAAWHGPRPYIKAVSLQYAEIDRDLLEMARQGGKKAPLLLVTTRYDDFYDAKTVAALQAAAAKSGTPLEYLHLPNSDHGYDSVNDTVESREAFLRTILFLRGHLPIRR